MRQLLTLGLFIFCSTQIVAQEVPTYNQHFLNPFVYNSAYAGSEGKPAAFLNYRNQWSGIEGAPVTSTFSIHAPLKNNVNLGFNIYTDKRSILSTSVANFTFGYTVDFNYDHFIQFGISAGVGINAVDQDASLNLSDPAVLAILDNSSFLDGNFGFLYHVGDLNFGLSLPRIFDNNRFLEDPFAVEPVSPLENYIISANYRFYFMNDDWALEPHVLFRKLSYALDPVVEGSLIVHANHLVWAGASYRQGYGLIGLIGLKSTNWALGYTYDFQGPQVAGGLNMTHELQLGYLFTKPQPKGRRRRTAKKEPQKPIASFVASQNIEFVQEKTNVAQNGNGSSEYHSTLGNFDTQAEGDEYKLRLRKSGFDVRLARSIVDQKFYVYSDNMHNARLAVASLEVTYIPSPDLNDIMRSEYIVVLDDYDNEEDAETYKQELIDRGIKAKNGLSSRFGRYFVYSMKTNQRAAAVQEAERLTEEGVGNATFVDFDRGELKNVQKAEHYVILNDFYSQEEAETYKDSLEVAGFKARYGISVLTKNYYVFTEKLPAQNAALTEVSRLISREGFANAAVMDVDPNTLIEVKFTDYYVTLGNYATELEAEQSKTSLRALGVSVNPYHILRNGRYFVYSQRLETDEEAQAENDRLVNDLGLSEVVYSGLDRNLILEIAETSGVSDRVSRGSHVLELPTGFYVIVGSYSTIAQATEFANTAVLPGYVAKFGYSSQKKLFYAYLFYSDSAEEAKGSREDIIDTGFFNNAWNLEVR